MLNENLRVEEILNLVATLKGLGKKNREKAKKLLYSYLGLNPLKKTQVKYLGFAEKRKLSLAQAMIVCPRVLILDEPTCKVDPVTRY